MSALLVGVDLGTTHLKVGIFAPDGDLKALAQRACAPEHAPGGRVEAPVESWWAAFEGALAECLDRVDRQAIRGIGVSSQAQTYVLLDSGHRPMGPMVSWLDTRGDAEGTARALAGHDYYAHVGWAQPMGMLASCKLRQLGARAPRVLFADGYLIHRLCGERVVSRNLAAMSGLYSMALHDWWPDALDAAGVSADSLPSIRETGEVAGQLSARLADSWGVPRVPVVVGANDQTAAAVGAGPGAAGDVTLALGTALVAYQVIAASTPVASSSPLRGPYLSDLMYHLGLCNTGCAVLDWARDALGCGIDPEGFFAEAATAPPGCGGLRVNPHMAEEEPYQGGAMAGLKLEQGRPHLFRAVLEGLACAAREQLDLLSAIGQVYITGGGSISDFWMQMIADVSQRTLTRLEQPQATLWGTALMAGGGAGLIDDVLATASTLRNPTCSFAPNADAAAVYLEVYQDYLKLRGRA